MRTLLIHADRFQYSLRDKTKMAEEWPASEGTNSFAEVLVAFTTVEGRDKDAVGIAHEAADQIAEVAGRVDAERIVVYPYAHLSGDLADPDQAVTVLKELEKQLQEKGLEVHRAAFGWYKSFDISCKGHPLSELSREIVVSPEDMRAAMGEGTYSVMTPDGTISDVEEYSSKDDDFGIVVSKEALKIDLGARKEPEYFRLCRKFGISWERMSDSGHMRWEPKAALIFDLISDYSLIAARGTGIPIYLMKGTNMFNLQEPAVREHADLFGDRLYSVEEGKKRFILRYAACHQQFAIMRDWTISYRQMPFGAFEVADSYRLEQSGECQLLFRVRRLNMPDLHIVCRDTEEAYDWFKKVHDRVMNEAKKLGIEYEMLINIAGQKSFEDNRAFIESLVREMERPALLHFYPEGINYYWTINIEYMMIDEGKRPREIGTVQIDIGNSRRFGITYADEQGGKQYPIILHTAIIGTIERYLYMIFDAAIKKEQSGGRGALPVWMNPEQVRILTVSERHLERAKDIMSSLQENGIRVGLDDRVETVGKKVREAKQDWVSYALVVGDRELESDRLKVYDRGENKDIEMALGQLIDRIRGETKGYPNRPMYFPSNLSKRIV
ncbi:MAG TPA: threonine--tRNA ligase [Euryarchaeota archaeon]|nr:threonine--tRNA ligase [Euryarchaeota archaeon]